MIRVLAKALDFDEQRGLHLFEGEPFTGVAYTLSKAQDFDKSSIEYRSGLRWGACREWYAPGQPMVESTWFQDALHGRAREWHRNGQLAEDGEYEYGIALWEKRWNEAGALEHDHRLAETDPGYARLLQFRALYGTPTPPKFA